MRKLVFLLWLLPALGACLPSQPKPSVNVEKDMFLSRQWNLAVLDLNYTGLVGKQQNGLITSVSAADDAGRIIATLLANEMSRLDNITIVERGQIEQLVEEQKLQLSGMINADSATRIGEMLGADAVLVGDVNDYLAWTSLGLNGSTVSFSMRLIEVESGRVLTSGSISKVENLTVAFQNAQKLARSLVDEIALQQ